MTIFKANSNLLMQKVKEKMFQGTAFIIQNSNDQIQPSVALYAY